MGSGYTYYPTSHYAALDAQKVALAKDKGITLIVIPCWWDGTQERYTPLSPSHPSTPPHLHTSTPPHLPHLIVSLLFPDAV